MSLVTTIAGRAVSAARARLERIRERASRDMVEGCLIETSQTVTGALTAALAISLGRNPFNAEVQQELEKLADDPAAVHRWHRHWTEILKSPSATRRRRLAAVLAVGSKITKSDEDRDRLDRLVEQLGEGEIIALQQIIDWRDAHPHFVSVDGVEVGLSLRRVENRFVLTSIVPRPEKHPTAREWELSSFTVNPIAISGLVGGGCILRLADARDDGGFVVTPHEAVVVATSTPLGDPK